MIFTFNPFLPATDVLLAMITPSLNETGMVKDPPLYPTLVGDADGLRTATVLNQLPDWTALTVGVPEIVVVVGLVT